MGYGASEKMRTGDYDPIGPKPDRFKELRSSFRSQNPLMQALLVAILARVRVEQLENESEANTLFERTPPFLGRVR